MIEVEKARRLFLANLYKKQENLQLLVNVVSGWIEKQALEGVPALSFNKTTFKEFDSLDDETMMHIASYFKAKGYQVRLKAKAVSKEKDNVDLIIEEVFIAWIDIISMLDKDNIKEQIK